MSTLKLAQVELFAPDSHDQDHVLLKEYSC